MKLKKAVEKLLIERGMSGAELSEITGIHASHIYSRISSKNKLDRIEKIAGAFDMKASELIALAETEETANNENG